MRTSLEFLLENINPLNIIKNNGEYKSALLAEYENLDKNAHNADSFFQILVPPGYLGLLEQILEILQEHDFAKYEKVHKGSPFYLLAINSFRIEDFERAVFYMDAAINEDIKNHKDIPNTPAKLFFRLDSEIRDQAAFFIVCKINDSLKSLFDDVKDEGGPIYNINLIVKYLLENSINNKPELRTIASSFLSFVMEFETRNRHIMLYSDPVGTGEPFFLHLLKGCVIFESLLVNSEIAKEIVSEDNRKSKKENRSPRSKTLKFFLEKKMLYQKLNCEAKPEGLNPKSFADLMDNIYKIKNDSDYSLKTIKIVWGLRNTIGHSISWTKLNLKEYNLLYTYTFGAICLVLDKLYKGNS